jgi:hypothetical protein
MVDANIAPIERAYNLYSGMNLSLLCAAGFIAVLIAVFSVLASRKGGELIRAKDRQLALALRDRDTQIEVANAVAAKAKEEAAKANEKAEAVRLEREKLEASLRPRVIVSTNETRKELGLFPGTNVAIEFEDANLEGKRFAEQLQFTLGLSKWSVLLLRTESHLPPGVGIFTKRLPDASLQQRLDDAATLFSYQLADDGIDNRLDTQGNPVPIPPPSAFTDSTIFVQIGEKPQQYLDSRRLEEIYRHMDKASADAFQKTDQQQEELRARIEPFIVQSQRENRERIVQRYTPKTTDKVD